MRDLSGLAALVTGGASGLGLATAQALASAGVKVAALDLRPGAAEPGILPIACDVADEGSVISALNLAEKANGISRIVVNCAGIPGSMRLVGRDGPVDMARFGQVIGVNLLGTVSVMTKAAARMMTLPLWARMPSAASSSTRPQSLPSRARLAKVPMSPQRARLLP